MAVDDAAVLNHFGRLLADVNSLVLATNDADGLPAASVVPYLLDDGAFYVFTSLLSEHTQYLKSEQPVGVLLLRDETDTRNLFARERIAMQCQPVVMSEGRDLILDKMTTKLGKTITLLRTLPDFHLFQLLPIQVRYVQGFGKAYTVDMSAKQFTLITGR